MGDLLWSWSFGLRNFFLPCHYVVHTSPAVGKMEIVKTLDTSCEIYIDVNSVTSSKFLILPELLHFFRVGVDYTNNVSFTYQNLYADVELCVFSVRFIGTRLLAVCWSKQSTPRAKFCLRFAHFVFIFSVMLFCCCWISCSSKSNTIVACTTTSV